jgi:hypothetical protein
VNNIEKVFLDTKAIFAKQAEEAVQEALDKIYTEYLPHVESDTQFNVYFQTSDWIADFLADRLDSDDVNRHCVHREYGHRAAEIRQKIYQDNKAEIVELIGKDYEREIQLLKEQLNRREYF